MIKIKNFTKKEGQKISNKAIKKVNYIVLSLLVLSIKKIKNIKFAITKI